MKRYGLSALVLLSACLAILLAQAIRGYGTAAVVAEIRAQAVAERGAEIEALRAETATLRQALDWQRGTAPLVWPMAIDDYVRVTSGFGRRELSIPGTGGTRTSDHAGVDLVGVELSRIVAAADGVVVDKWHPPGTVINGRVYTGDPVFGGKVILDHGDYQTLYGHMSIVYVHEGETVIAGQVIGRQGDTGQAYGAHLHFEVLVDGRPVTPLKWMEGI